MELPELKKCHLLRLSIPDLILGSILDPPKCAEEGSRCSLSLVFTCLACFKMTQKWTSEWTPLRPKISARLLLGASRATWGSHFCASELMLKNVSKMYRNGSRFESPSSLRRISVESPSNLHRLLSDEDPYIYTRCSESEGLSLRSGSLKHQIWDGMMEDIPHARPLKGRRIVGMHAVTHLMENIL